MTQHKEKHGTLPPDIIEFFSLGGRSLIIRGAPGTGKTTLALEILEQFKSKGESIFISARIDEQSLKGHLKWIDFDMLLSRGRDEGSRNRKKGRISRKELDRLESRVEDGDESLESDYDPEPSAGSVEGDTWTIDITSLLPELDSLYEKLETKMPPMAMVALDSIDSLAEKYGIAPKRLIHTLQKDLVERSNINAIFILETADSNNLEYMGDGVISLESEDIGGRRLRFMRLEKMRGQRIWNPEMPFSLSDGRFDCFMGEQDAEPTVNLAATVPNIALSELLDGITEPGRYTVIEFDGTVPADIARGIVKSIMKATTQERGIYTTPSIRLFGFGLSESVDPAEKNCSDAVKFIGPAEFLQKRSLEAGIIRVDGDSFPLDFNFEFIEGLFPNKGRLFLIDANQIISYYGQNSMNDLENHISHLLSDKGTCIAFSWPSSNPVIEMNLGMSDRFVKVTNRGSKILFYGEKPHTPIYILASDDVASRLRVVL